MWRSAGQGDGHAASRAPGDDGDLMHRVLGGQLVDDHGMARLVVSGELLGVLGDHAAFLLRACDDLHHSLVEVLHGDKPLVCPGSQQRGLVEQVLQGVTATT